MACTAAGAKCQNQNQKLLSCLSCKDQRFPLPIIGSKGRSGCLRRVELLPAALRNAGPATSDLVNWAWELMRVFGFNGILLNRIELNADVRVNG